MSENENRKMGSTNNNNEGSLSDERRVSVMSPSMLVFKRFIRNRLAVIGFVILAVMFLFAFLGPLLSPYGSRQQFQKTSTLVKEYAEYMKVTDWRTSMMDSEFKYAVTEATQHIGKDEPSFKYEDKTYYLRYKGDKTAVIISAPVKYAVYVSGEVTASETGVVLPEALVALIRDAVSNNLKSVMYEGQEYMLENERDPDRIKIIYNVYTYDDVALLVKLAFHAAEEKNIEAMETFEFKHNALDVYFSETAETSFVADGVTYSVGPKDSEGFMEISLDGKLFAKITDYIVQGKYAQFLSLEYKKLAYDTITKGDKEFEYEYIPIATEETEPTTAPAETPLGGGVSAEETPIPTPVQNTEPQLVKYMIERKDFKFTIKANETVTVFDSFATPSGKHVLGTEQYSMDLATRLMYGGRVSLLVGFVVVFIEILIGVVLGGLAGYFSGWVDVIIMRIIELFNCIPFYPLLMIIGAIMDAVKVDNQARIFMLMVVLGVLSWPGIARIVRGQILSLREQDFIVATEACGIPVNRRIFRHLIPNVIPLLIVTATMGLGSIIITEATLGFLGLGVKFPDASWGSIINQASSAYVMQSYWWVWVPAGVLILLTVLGFNFVGDGLRDAFDPKMKR